LDFPTRIDRIINIELNASSAAAFSRCVSLRTLSNEYKTFLLGGRPSWILHNSVAYQNHALFGYLPHRSSETSKFGPLDLLPLHPVVAYPFRYYLTSTKRPYLGAGHRGYHTTALPAIIVHYLVTPLTQQSESPIFGQLDLLPLHPAVARPFVNYPTNSKHSITKHLNRKLFEASIKPINTHRSGHCKVAATSLDINCDL